MTNPKASYPRFSSVKTLLNGLFDYAGMFPPASLPLAEALREYLGHQAEPDAWMVGPFVIPVGKLDELLILLNDGHTHDPLRLIILPRSSPSAEESLQLWSEDLDVCSNFVLQAQGRASIESFEFRFPPDLFSDPDGAARFVSKTCALFDTAGFENASLFGEIIRTPSYSGQLPIYFLTLASASSGHPIWGKLRCGGMNQADFPSPTELAQFIHTAIHVDHPFKATAGLHHPVRHFNEDQGVDMHGFLNVMFAITLGRVHHLDPSKIQEIIEERNPLSFEFIPSGIRWNTLAASTTDFIFDRKRHGLSIGSCSFNDPRADLVGLGWLTHEPAGSE
jgi:hypothetical protein